MFNEDLWLIFSDEKNYIIRDSPWSLCQESYKKTKPCNWNTCAEGPRQFIASSLIGSSVSVSPISPGQLILCDFLWCPWTLVPALGTFLPAGLPHAALIGEELPSLAATLYMIVDWYTLEVCIFLAWLTYIFGGSVRYHHDGEHGSGQADMVPE